MKTVPDVLDERYGLIEKIGEGKMSYVYLARDLEEGKDVVLKAFKREATSSAREDFLRFRNEAATVSRLKIPGIVRIYEIGEAEGFFYMAMELLEGENLQQFMEYNRYLSLEASLEIVAQVAKTLEQVHKAGVIHRDLNPENIFIERDTGTPFSLNTKVTDFGVARLKEFSMEDAEGVAESLSYMSPEQSGAIKRITDERSDLYSLGVVFYRLFTGILPYYSDNLVSIIHQHIAKVPPPPSSLNPEVEPALDKIIIKLLDKEPERRHQSASGLLSDLEKYRRGEEDFWPGSGDRLHRLNLKTTLVNREFELKQLKQAFLSAKQGEGSICFVKGEAGAGKTRLIEELRDYIMANRGIFLEGSCLSDEDSYPYSPVKSAVEEFFYYYYRYPLEQKHKNKKRVQEAVGKLGRVLYQLNREIEDLLEEAPPLVTLEPSRESRRFHIVASSFLLALGEKNFPLVLAVENFQWADEGTVEVLKELMSRVNHYPVVLLVVSRDDNLEETDRINLLLEEAGHKKVSYKEIKLLLFAQEEMKSYISRVMGDHPERVSELSSFLMSLTEGNPLFALELLKQMVEKGLVENTSQGWVIRQEGMEQMQIKAGLVDVLMEKISYLSQKEQELLAGASLFIRYIDLNILSRLLNIEEAQFYNIVEGLVKKQFLKQYGREKSGMIFAHDRLREVFYQKVSEDCRKEMHFQLAELLERDNSYSMEMKLYEIAHHYTEAGIKEKAAFYNYLAGYKARETYALEEALAYLRKTVDIMEEKGFQGTSNWLDAMECRGEIYLSQGDNEAAIEVFTRMLNFTRGNKMLKIRTYQNLARVYLYKGEWSNCEKTAILGLELLGEKLPLNRLEINKALLKELAVRGWHRVFEYYYDSKKPGEKGGEYQQEFSFLKTLGWSYMLNDLTMYVYNTIRMLNLAEARLGLSREKSTGMDAYANVLMNFAFYGQAEKYLNKSMKIKVKLGDKPGIALYYQNMGYLYQWKGDYEKSINYFQESVEMLEHIGDFKEVGFSLNGMVQSYLFLSDYSRMKETMERYLDFVVRHDNNSARRVIYIYEAHYYRETGDLESALRCGEEALDLTYRAGEWLSYVAALVATGMCRLEKGEVNRSIELLQEACRLADSMRLVPQYSSKVYVVLLEAYLEYYLLNREYLTRKEKEKYLGKIKNTRQKALFITRKLPTYRGSALRCTAREACFRGKYRKAQKMFRLALEHSKRFNRKFDQGRVLYHCGLFLKEMEYLDDSREMLKEAYRIFKDLGARGYESRLFSLLEEKMTGDPREERYTRELSQARRMMSIIEVSREISSVLELNELLDKVISVAIEVTGAQAGYLVLQNEKTGRMEVCARKSMADDEGSDSLVSSQLVREAASKEQPVLSTNAAEDERYAYFDNVKECGLKSVLCVPIKYGNRVKGVCYLVNNLTTGVFTAEDLEVLEVIMGQAAVSIENARLYEQAVTDDLTGLYSLKHFKLLLQNEMERSLRYQHGFSLVMMDIDRLRKLNNVYGHQAGDRLLVKIAEVVKANSRGADVLARYGGEEFIFMLPETDTEGARKFAEKIRKKVEEVKIIDGENKLGVTVSMGVASYPHHATTVEALINAVDSAMYISKGAGRNKVTVYY